MDKVGTAFKFDWEGSRYRQSPGYNFCKTNSLGLNIIRSLKLHFFTFHNVLKMLSEIIHLVLRFVSCLLANLVNNVNEEL